ncbi:periphilin-1-like isoform X3 [Dunckerocampus dactyliophorus]|uniref:periphilin-1-like isoform X3 n=1 Tax=Dunckerocampus dactyliophorus TaxID=161453 RepID=UPI002404D96F|nr:periphilin-1-like isoform X3 [Dunckerocampus dactyliophorus]
MAFRHQWHSVREQYEQHFSPMDTREVTVHRVVNIVDRRSAHPSSGGAMSYDRGFDDDQWYNEGPNYHGETCHMEDDYLPNRYYNENPNYGNVRRESPCRHQEPPYQRPRYGRDDLRHQLRSRQNGRPGPYFKTRGRGQSHDREERNHFRHGQNVEWERFPGKRKGPPAAKKNGSSESDKGSGQSPKTDQSLAVTVHTPSGSVGESPQTSSLLKQEKPSDSETGAEEKEVVLEVAPPSLEPKTTQDEDVKARRSEAIKAKALDIEKHYRQDCQTFSTVVKMLVSKEPTLETLLQGALSANLTEMKDHCLATLRHYVKELDEALELSGTPS